MALAVFGRSVGNCATNGVRMSVGVRAGYKQTEVGVIPKDWAVAELQAVCAETITYGIVQCGPHIENGVPYIRVSDMNGGDLEVIGMLRTSFAIASKFARSRVEEGDLVYALRGQTGEVRSVNKSVAGANLTQGTARLSPTKQVDSTFLLYCLRSQQALRQADLSAKGSTFREITLESLRRIQVPIATFPEQRAIATALSDVDALLSGLDSLIAKKQNLKQAAMQQLLTGQTRLPGFSGEWEVKRLGDVADIDPENLGSNTPSDYEFKYISLEDVDRGVLVGYSEQVFMNAPSRARRKLKRGDVLVSTVRPNLQSHLIFQDDAPDWVCSTGFAVIRCRIGVTNPAYVFPHIFGSGISRQIEALLTGSNYPAINSRDVRALEIPIPPYTEQTAIATVLSDMDTELAALQARLGKTRALKQGMMQELLTGRIRLV